MLPAIEIVQADITKLKVDAIVNAAAPSLLGGGGVDGAIHEAAGPELLEECKNLNGCKTGEAKITKGYKLPAKHVIHTVGPVYSQQSKEESEKLLHSCYLNSLELANKHKLATIAFPAISTGVYGYPKLEAAHIAHRAIIKFVHANRDHGIQKIILVAFSDEDKQALDEAFADPFRRSKFMWYPGDIEIIQKGEES